MSDIKLVSQNYSDEHYLGITKGDGSVFIDGPVVFKDGIYMPGGSPFITGPELEYALEGKQDRLTASTGINLNGSTISVNTATSVGTSTLPVTASAVNTKLSSYVNSVSSPDGSITVSKSGSSVTLKANGGGGNYVPLGSYGSTQKTGALPIGYNSTASGDDSIASGRNSTASGNVSIALGYNSTASGDYSTATGNFSTASGDTSTASGYDSTASGYGSTASGNGSTASGDYSTATGSFSTASGDTSTAIGCFSAASAAFAQVFGSYGRNSNDSCTVIAAMNGTISDCGAEIEYATQLYLMPKGSPLANLYEDGEACLGYVTAEYNYGNWNKIASGTKKLSELLNNNINTFEPKLTQEP